MVIQWDFMVINGDLIEFYGDWWWWMEFNWQKWGYEWEQPSGTLFHSYAGYAIGCPIDSMVYP